MFCGHVTKAALLLVELGLCLFMFPQKKKLVWGEGGNIAVFIFAIPSLMPDKPEGCAVPVLEHHICRAVSQAATRS